MFRGDHSMAETKVIVRKKPGSSLPWKQLFRKICLAGMLGVVLWLILLRLWSAVLPVLLQYQEVEAGTLWQTLDIENGLIVRDEMVVVAEGHGTFHPRVPEGERVAEGEVVATVETGFGGNQVIKAPRAGVVCYRMDGWETVLNPQSIETLDIAGLDEVAFQPLKEVPQGAQVEPGQPVLKIVNNLQPTLIWLKFDSQYLDLFPPTGKKISLNIGDEVYRGTLRSLVSQGVVSQGLLELDRAEFFHDRRLNFSILLNKAQGIKVPNKALVHKEEEPGVYKKSVNGYQWVPVRILLQDENYSVVEGLLKGDQVITNPGLIHETSIPYSN